MSITGSKLVWIFLGILFLNYSALAQEPGKKPDVAPTTEQQKSLRELLLASDKAMTDLATAQNNADIARQRFFAELFRVMAELGLKPSEYSVVQQADGSVVFEKNKVAQVEKKPDEKKP